MWFRRLLGLIALFIMLVPLAAHAGRCSTVPKIGLFERPDTEGGPTRVLIGIYVIDLTQIDDIDQTFRADFVMELKWRDPRLAREKAGRQTCVLRLDEVWHPHVLVLNQRALARAFDDIVEIDAQGGVTYIQRYQGWLSVSLNLRDFPFDRQTLRIKILSRDYGPDEVSFVDDEGVTGRRETLSIADWSIGPATSEVSVFYFEPGAVDLSRFNYELEARRHPGYYFLRAIFPLMIIIFVSWTVFWLDPSQLGTQIGLSATTIVMLFVFQLKLGDLLPRISYLTRTDLFVLASQVLVFLALVQSIISGTLAVSGKQTLARRLDRWARFIFPASFVVVLLIAFWV